MLLRRFTPILLVVGALMMATASADASDKQIANQSLVHLTDLPSGWRQQDPSGPKVNVTVCRAVRRARRLTSATSGLRGSFRHGNTYVAERALVYATATRARRVFRNLTSLRTRSCIRRGLARGFEASDANAEVLGIRSFLIRAPDGGDARQNQRYRIRVAVEGTRALIVADNAYTRVGRVISAQLFVSPFAPLRFDLRRDVLSTAETRMRSALSRDR